MRCFHGPCIAALHVWGCTDCSGMCACLPELCCWRWIVWCMHVSCIDTDVHSCFELWSALGQSSWIRRCIRITYYYYYLVATKVCFPRQTRVCCDKYLSRQKLGVCWDKSKLVATKRLSQQVLLVTATSNDIKNKIKTFYRVAYWGLNTLHCFETLLNFWAWVYTSAEEDHWISLWNVPVF